MKTPMTYSKTLLSAGGILLLGALSTHAATVTQTAGDGYGVSSLTGSANWSDATVPSAANDYETNYLLRTPNGSNTANITFAGNSLTLLVTSSGTGQLGYKGAGGTTITVNNLHLNGGIVVANNLDFTLAGNMSLDSTGTTAVLSNGNSKNLTVSASIGGVGKLITSGAATFTLTNTANTYSGGTLVGGNGILDVKADGALGTGDISVNSSILKLGSGVTNNYIADTAKLTLNAGTLNLNFTGIDYLTAVTLDNGVTLHTTVGETFGAIGSGATYTSSLITGTGLLEIVPEPRVNAMLLLGGAGLLFQVLRRKRCTA